MPAGLMTTGIFFNYLLTSHVIYFQISALYLTLPGNIGIKLNALKIYVYLRKVCTGRQPI